MLFFGYGGIFYLAILKKYLEDKTMKKIFAILLTLVLVAGVFAACGGNTTEETTAAAGEKLTATEGVLVMATNAAFPPYEFKEGEDFAGIDVEIAGKIAEKLGLTLEIKDVEFGSIVGGVQTGKFDMGMAGMTVTDERLESVNFSTSYATGIQVVIVAEDSAIKSLDDLKGDGSMKFGVQQDTTGDIYASDTAENGGYGEENVIRYKTGADAVQALKTGKVDAVIIDNEPAKSFVAANEGLTILDGEWTLENYAIAIAKENTALLTAVNNALAELTADGTVASIIAKYIPASEETTDAADETTEAAAEETTEAAA